MRFEKIAMAGIAGIIAASSLHPLPASAESISIMDSEGNEIDLSQLESSAGSSSLSGSSSSSQSAGTGETGAQAQSWTAGSQEAPSASAGDGTGSEKEVIYDDGQGTIYYSDGTTSEYDAGDAPSYETGLSQSDYIKSLTDEELVSGVLIDKAGIAGEKAKQEIADQNREIAKFNDGYVIVVYTSNDTLEGVDLDSYKKELFDKLRVGATMYDRGVLIAVFPEAHKYAVEIGDNIVAGMRHYLMEDYIADIAERYFTKGDYDDGLQLAVNSTAQIIISNAVDTSSSQVTSDTDTTYEFTGNSDGHIVQLIAASIAIPLIGLVAILVISRRVKKKPDPTDLTGSYVFDEKGTADRIRAIISGRKFGTEGSWDSHALESRVSALTKELTGTVLVSDVIEDSYRKWYMSSVLPKELSSANGYVSAKDAEYRSAVEKELRFDNVLDLDAIVASVNGGTTGGDATDSDAVHDESATKQDDDARSKAEGAIAEYIASVDGYRDIRTRMVSRIADFVDGATADGMSYEALSDMSRRTKKMLDGMASDIRFADLYESASYDHRDMPDVPDAGFASYAKRNPEWHLGASDTVDEDWLYARYAEWLQANTDEPDAHDAEPSSDASEDSEAPAETIADVDTGIPPVQEENDGDTDDNDEEPCEAPVSDKEPAGDGKETDAGEAGNGESTDSEDKEPAGDGEEPAAGKE